MAVRQLGPGDRSAAARRPAPFVDPEAEVKRVMKLLEEYTEKWRGCKECRFWERDFDVGRPLGVVTLSADAKGVEVLLKYEGEPRPRLLRLVPPEDARKAAEELVKLERRFKLVSQLLGVVMQWERAWWFIALEALRRYAPLFGKNYNVPELAPKTGDVYRDLLEALYAASVYSAVAEEAQKAAAVPWPADWRTMNFRVKIPVEPPIPLSYDEAWRDYDITRAELRAGGWFEIAFRDAWDFALGNSISPRYSSKTGSRYLSVLDAALLMLFERERGILTKLSEIIEKKASALDAVSAEVLEEFPVAAEAAALLFG